MSTQDYGFQDIESPIRILISTRKNVTSSRTAAIHSRTYANLDQILQSLRTMAHQVEILQVDFGDHPIPRQVALAHSVDIIIGFHGAGMSHMFHMNPERSRCCGVVELFPQPKGCNDWNFDVCDFAKRQGYANQARYLGLLYAPFVCSPDSHQSNGSVVDPERLRGTVEDMIVALLYNRSA
eukprot:gene5857-7473_t